MSEFSPSEPIYVKRYGRHLEEVIDMLEYLTLYQNCSKKERKKLKKARAEAREFARKMQKNKINGVFKDPDDWNLIR